MLFGLLKTAFYAATAAWGANALTGGKGEELANEHGVGPAFNAVNGVMDTVTGKVKDIATDSANGLGGISPLTMGAGAAATAGLLKFGFDSIRGKGMLSSTFGNTGSMLKMGLLVAILGIVANKLMETGVLDQYLEPDTLNALSPEI